MAVVLDLNSFDSAILRLTEAVDALASQAGNDLIRDAAIQRFEFTYELSHKMLRRYLAVTAPASEEIERMSFQDLIRTGSEQGLLRSDWERWHDWRRAREITSHAYDEAKARQIAAIIPDFLAEARYLNEQLRARASRP